MGNVVSSASRVRDRAPNENEFGYSTAVYTGGNYVDKPGVHVLH